MAQAKAVRGTKLLIKVGDGGSPEVFTHNCSINGARAFQLTSQTNDIAVPDCDDPDLMAWIEREKVSLSGQITGEGVFNAPDIDVFYDWSVSPNPKNVKVIIDILGVDGGRIFSGAFHCNQFEISGNRGEKITANIQLVSTGVIVKTNNP